MGNISKLADLFIKKYAQALPLGESEKVRMPVGEAIALATEWYNRIPQSKSDYTTAKDLLGYLLDKRPSGDIIGHQITAHSRYWATQDVKEHFSDIIDPEIFKETINVLWDYKKH